MYVILEYDRSGRPSVMHGEVYDDRADALALAAEQDSTRRFAGRPARFKVCSLLEARSG